MIIVTSYDSPDLDGIACSIGYSNLLAQQGISSKSVYFGQLGPEVMFVQKYTNYFPVIEQKGEYPSGCEIVLVDTSDPEDIDPAIPLGNVSKIYDHRLLNSVDKFPNAQKHIELVGSCATLITEEYQKVKLKPSKPIAVYLYSAIVSNTINFKNAITTNTDIDSANWLNDICQLDLDYVRQMFLAKSNINNDSLYQSLFQDFLIKTMSGKRIGIAQLEIVDIDRTIGELKSELIKSLTRLRQDNKIDFLLFNGIDIFKGYNIFFTVDDSSLTFFSKVFDLPDFYAGYKTDHIVMRKEIIPKVEKALSQQ